jgi:CheY-like chemotaxis protein
LPNQTAPGIRKQYLHLSLYRCEHCRGPVVAASAGIRESEIARETDIRLLGAACLSCGNVQPAEPDNVHRFPPVQWETPKSVAPFPAPSPVQQNSAGHGPTTAQSPPFREEEASSRRVDQGCPIPKSRSGALASEDLCRECAIRNSHEGLHHRINPGMTTKSTVLYIHLDATHRGRGRSFLKNGGYAVLSAASGRPALRLLASHAVDAVVVDDGVIREELAVAGSIKGAKPSLPIIMMADHVRLHKSALSSVDALVAKADPPEFLLATLHFLLNVKRAGVRARPGRPARKPLSSGRSGVARSSAQ